LTYTDSMFAVTMSRNPVARLVSSFKSKIRCPTCGHSDESDRRQFVPPLSGDKHIRCLSFHEFVEVLYQRRSKPFNTKGSPHWQRQSRYCAFDKIQFNSIVPLETVGKESFWPLFRYLGLDLLSFPHLHVEYRRLSNNSTKIDEMVNKTQLRNLRNLTKKIYAIYASDYAVYNYTQNIQRDTRFIWNFFNDKPRSCLFSTTSTNNTQGKDKNDAWKH
jgi:hypothetical protein